ncbi:DNA-directed RNA polymerase subunit alpha C-terminal domain-containing protein [Planomonospora sp. ID82291]|uniref:DNA-directed RNA polymerase subunit alpha C-terminal domain-containing protein n=1 Tax=Planomonospora sp. ID82291 TaxID=2738136 RepID=UPI0018C3B3D0|nr:DNA-directed RNA polymerase subunit alpha C-terminal domain-containing protein [Planomonospora sp. ID82291]MBG0818939.1 hypothetical protein [Planomonospora sp. ID82291]
MSTPTQSMAELVAKSGLPDDHPIKALPGLTWHVTKPLEKASIVMVGDLAARTDAELLGVPKFGGRRLEAVKAALARATGDA